MCLGDLSCERRLEKKNVPVNVSNQSVLGMRYAAEPLLQHWQPAAATYIG